MRDFESSFHFLGMLGGLKGRKRRVKSIFYFLFLEQVPLFKNFLCYGFGGTMLVCLLFVNFLFPNFCLIHTFIFLFLIVSFFCEISGFAIFAVGRLLLTLDKIRRKNS